MDRNTDLTPLLLAWSKGDRAALDKLMPLVYDELRRIARRYFSRERADHTLQPTALVNEAYLRLINQKNANWKNRAQFYGIAAQLMRRILVDRARARLTAKRGEGMNMLQLEEAIGLPKSGPKLVDLIALDDALNELVAIDPELSRIMELKFFVGLTLEEISEVMGAPLTTVHRKEIRALAELKRQLGG